MDEEMALAWDAGGLESRRFSRKYILIFSGLLSCVAVIAVLLFIPAYKHSVIYGQLMDGRLKDADYWDSTPKILSANLELTSIVGLPSLDHQTVADAGGFWDAGLTCTNGKTPTANQRTDAVLSSKIQVLYKVSSDAIIDHADSLSIVFSWPVRSDTIDPRDFKFTLNTGEVIYPSAAGIVPDWELDERNVVVVIGHLGNRANPGQVNARYPVRLDIVTGQTELILVGPTGEISAVGLSWSTAVNSNLAGPTLVGAKLNRVEPQSPGEAGVQFIGQKTMPNDEVTLYGSQAQFRLRMLTTGSFSSDGVHGILPNQFEKYFRLQADGPDGKPVIMDKVGVVYLVAGGTLRIVGLSDLGQKANPANGIIYDKCYAEDHDNYIDVILAGDESAARHIKFVEMPGLAGGYQAVFNRSNLGPDSSYATPSPAVIEPVTIALDDPMRISR